jgi:hypothetical protein
VRSSPEFKKVVARSLTAVDTPDSPSSAAPRGVRTSPKASKGVAAAIKATLSSHATASRPISPYALSTYRIATIVLRVLGPYARHFLLSPYRTEQRSRRLRGRVRLLRRAHFAAFDTLIERLLEGYSSLTRRPLPVEAGALAVQFTRFAQAFDDVIEELFATTRPSVDDVMEHVAVKRMVKDLRAFALSIASPETVEIVEDTLMGALRADFDRYRDLTAADSVEALLEAAALDAGNELGYLSYVMGLVFHGSPPAAEVIDAFRTVGIISKLADDLRDCREDYLTNRPNIMIALAGSRQFSAAKNHLTALPNGTLSAKWWKTHRADAYAGFFQLVDHYRRQLPVEELHLSCDLMILSALIPRLY